MKKAISIIIAGVLISGAGYGAYQQSQFQSHVKNAVTGLVSEIDGYQIEDQRISAALTEHRGGLFSSEGLVKIVAGESDKLSVLEISYRVDHDALAMLNGARFEASAVNTLLGGRDDKTITGLLFGGQAIEVNGQIQQGSVSGTTTVPEVSLVENKLVITSAPLVSDWTLMLTGQGMSADTYQASWSMPELSFSENRTVPSRLSVSNLSGSVSRTVDGGGDRGDMSMKLEQLRFSGAQGSGQAGGIAISSSTEIADLAMSAMRFSVDNAKVQGMDVGPAVLDLKVDRINGEAVRKFVTLLERAQQEQWDESRITGEFEKLVVLAGDQLLVNDPTLTLNSLQVNAGEQGDARLSGSLSLDHSKLSPTAVRDAINGNRQVQQQLQQQLVLALKGKLSMTTSGMAQTLVQGMLGRVNPALSEEAADGQLEFSLDSGAVTVDGKAI